MGARAVRCSRRRKAPSNCAVIARERIELSILLLRGQKVMLSRDLARLYGEEPRALVQAVKRNAERFPADFMFRLSIAESRALRSQFVILDGHPQQACVRPGRPRRGRYAKYPPLAFTEQGVAMLSSVLNSPRAIAVNIETMRAFVRLRQILASHADLARKLAALERKYDAQSRVVFGAIRELMVPPVAPPKGRIGFRSD